MLRLSTFYCINCPVCGRPLRVRLEMMGSEVCCSHCRAAFVAETAVDRNTYPRRTRDIDRRVEAMLAVSGEGPPRNEPEFSTEPGSHEPIAHRFYEYQK